MLQNVRKIREIENNEDEKGEYEEKKEEEIQYDEQSKLQTKGIKK